MSAVSENDGFVDIAAATTRMISSATASAPSTGSTWPAPGTTTRCASGIDAASSDDSAADTVRSLSPMTTTGTLISLSRWERSTPSNRRVNPRRLADGLANPT